MNRLADETSPYLRQHADNPVDWYPWGDEAFAEARRRNVPIFLSVGYSSCHWCHVMAHESFESAEIAALMNESFVNVKVDREERPDVDAIYMQATQAMTGRGGWPMSVWLTPDGRPFHAGTYFPAQERPGVPSMPRVCRAVSDAWQERRDEVDDLAHRLTSSISDALPTPDDVPALHAELFSAAVETLRREFDAEHGGFGTAPKFPHGTTVSLVCRAETRRRTDGDPDAQPTMLEMITTTLDAMACGGIYDQIGGGFARYSVDAQWMIPHFEKMLYDNALLVRAYTDGWRLTRSPRWERVVAETIDWMTTALRHELGGFYSAYDADSDGVEGKFYAWHPDEVREVCGSDADAAIAWWGITDHGNFVDPHTGFRGTVLQLVERTREPDATIQRARQALAQRRADRVHPGLDDKVLTAWNAYAVRALAEAGEAFGRPDWIADARRCAEFLLSHLTRSDGRLLRSWQADATPIAGQGADGRARHLAYAEDHAALCDALVTLAEIDGPLWLDPARAIADSLITLFHDADGGGFFSTGSDAETLVVRAKDQMDNATPAANSTAANALARLGALCGDDRYLDIATTCVRAVSAYFARHPAGFADAMEAAERLTFGPREIVVVGAVDDPRTASLWEIAAAARTPGTVTLRVTPDDVPNTPLLDGRLPHHGAPLAYVCERFECARPVSEPDELRTLLGT